MRSCGILPDTITLNVLIDGLRKDNEVDREREILRAIEFPDVKSYTSVISGYCKLGKMEEAMKVFDEMVEFGIRPSRVSYNVLIDGYGKVCDLRSANLVFERMRMCGCSPDVVTSTSLIYGYCESGQLDDAMKLLHEMGVKQVRPSAHTFSIIIDSLCKKNRLKEARELLKELNGRKDILACPFIYNPVIDGFCKAGNLEEANSVLVEMEERACRPDKYTFTILISGHCMKGRTRMMASACAPDSITVNTFISLLFKSGMRSEANRIMNKTLGKDTGLHVSTLKEIPSLLTKSADVSVAL